MPLIMMSLLNEVNGYLQCGIALQIKAENVPPNLVTAERVPTTKEIAKFLIINRKKFQGSR
jgi:DNA-binding transcriptional regulator YhcF (GntR family)